MSQVLPQPDYVHEWGNIDKKLYVKLETKSKWKGVETRDLKKFTAIIKVPKKIRLGTFADVEQAAIVYAKAKHIQTPSSSDPKPHP